METRPLCMTRLDSTRLDSTRLDSTRLDSTQLNFVLFIHGNGHQQSWFSDEPCLTNKINANILKLNY